MNNKLTEIANYLIENDNYIIVGHTIPDGDCIGSMIALHLALNNINKHNIMYLNESVPAIYNFLTDSNLIMQPKNLPSKDYNTVIYLDCSDEDRIGSELANLIKDTEYIINIDHHPTNNYFGKLNYVDSKAAATAEIITKLIEHLKINITSDIANALYTGIVMDTGGFQYSNTTSNTLRIAAILLDAGVEQEKARINLFESKSKEEVMLLRKALQSITISNDGKIAWMKLTNDDINEIGAKNLHPEGIVNYTRSIKGVEVGMVFREISSGVIKVGFRSKTNIDVSVIAQKFGGGGHMRAAGAQCEGELDDVIETVISAVKEVIQ